MSVAVQDLWGCCVQRGESDRERPYTDTVRRGEQRAEDRSREAKVKRNQEKQEKRIAPVAALSLFCLFGAFL